MASQDDNGVQILYGVSHLDGRTLVPIKFLSGGNIMIDTATSISFDPNINASISDNAKKIARATSSADNTTIRPWVVNASTGAVLVAQ